MRSRTQRGFTLLEVLVAAAVTGLIVSTVYLAYSSSLRGIDRGRGRAGQAQIARWVLRDMRNTIGCAVYFPESGICFFKGEASGGESGERARLLFTSAAHRRSGPGAKESDLCEVSYFLKQDIVDGNNLLVKRVKAPPDKNPGEGGEETVLGDSVRSLGFSYFDGEEWVENWDDEEAEWIPEAVRVALAIAAPGGEPPLELEYLIPIPMGKEEEEIEETGEEEEEEEEEEP